MSENTKRRRERGQVSSVAADRTCSTSAPTREEAFAAFCVLVAFVTGQGSAPDGEPMVTSEDVETLFPGLTARAFADAARRGEFAARKHGRKLAATRADVEEWLESRRVRPRARKTSDSSTDPEVAYLRMVNGGAQ